MSPTAAIDALLIPASPSSSSVTSRGNKPETLNNHPNNPDLTVDIDRVSHAPIVASTPANTNASDTIGTNPPGTESGRTSSQPEDRFERDGPINFPAKTPKHKKHKKAKKSKHRTRRDLEAKVNNNPNNANNPSVGSESVTPGGESSEKSGVGGTGGEPKPNPKGAMMNKISGKPIPGEKVYSILASSGLAMKRYAEEQARKKREEEERIERERLEAIERERLRLEAIEQARLDKIRLAKEAKEKKKREKRELERLREQERQRLAELEREAAERERVRVEALERERIRQQIEQEEREAAQERKRQEEAAKEEKRLEKLRQKKEAKRLERERLLAQKRGNRKYLFGSDEKGGAGNKQADLGRPLRGYVKGMYDHVQSRVKSSLSLSLSLSVCLSVSHLFSLSTCIYLYPGGHSAECSRPPSAPTQSGSQSQSQQGHL